jgi:hypothetical protein
MMCLQILRVQLSRLIKMILTYWIKKQIKKMFVWRQTSFVLEQSLDVQNWVVQYKEELKNQIIILQFWICL